jgi:hypothetical protein
MTAAAQLQRHELWGMRHLASIRRRDGHTIDGIPGDCFRCSLAYVWGIPADAVPHFGLYLSWWAEARRWVRWASGDRYDLWYVDLDDPHGWDQVPDMPAGQDDFDAELVVMGGPSPRGPFGHAVAGRLVDGWPIGFDMEFDPHPSAAGLLDVVELFVIRPAVFPLPPRTAIGAAA